MNMHYFWLSGDTCNVSLLFWVPDRNRLAVSLVPPGDTSYAT